MWLVWKDKFTKIIDKHAPLKTRKIGKNRTPWMTNEILLNKRHKNLLKEGLQSVLRIGSAHNKGGPPNINIVQISHFSNSF